MAQSKNIGHGTLFARQTGTPTTIGQIRSITMPSRTREDVDATDLDDTIKYYVPSDPEDEGELTVEMMWTPEDAVDALLDTDFAANTVASWRVTFASPISKTATFNAWVKSLTPATIESATVISRTAVLRLQSAITWA